MPSSTWGSRTRPGTGQGLRLVLGAQGDAATATGHPEKRHLVTATRVSWSQPPESPGHQHGQAGPAPGHRDSRHRSLIPLGRDIVGSALGIAAEMFCFFSSLFKGQTRLDSRKKEKNPNSAQFYHGKTLAQVPGDGAGAKEGSAGQDGGTSCCSHLPEVMPITSACRLPLLYTTPCLPARRDARWTPFCSRRGCLSHRQGAAEDVGRGGLLWGTKEWWLLAQPTGSSSS